MHHNVLLRAIPPLLALLLPQAGAAAARPAPAPPDALACGHGIDAAQRPNRMPVGLLHAIATVESGRPAGAGGTVRPWPWTINVEGAGYFYATKGQAVAAVRLLQDAGVRSIDIGCMQINLMYHPRAFATLEDAFEPQANVAYAVRFLSALFHQTGSWPQAAAAYHSQTPQVGLDYQRRVMALYPMRLPDAPARPVEVAQAEEPDDRTPEFRQLQRQSEEDHARLARRFGSPAAAPQAAPAQLAARHRPAPPARSRLAASVPDAATRRTALLRLAGTGWLDGASTD